MRPRIARERVAWTLAAVSSLIAIAGIGFAAYAVRAPRQLPEMRVQVVAPAGPVTSFALSPDGRSLVFAADGQLWLRPLDAEAAHPLAGTENGLRPFWSPDSRSIAFIGGDDTLKEFDISTGAVQTLAGAPLSAGGAWGPDGTILVQAGRTISKVRGVDKPAAATRVESPRQTAHRFPRFLPDGRHFLFYSMGTAEGRGVYVGSLDSLESRRLLDRQGKQIGVIGQPEAGEAMQLRPSSDGRTVAISRTVNANRDIWLMDATRGVLNRLTSDPAREGQPLWSPDGKRLVFFSDRTGTYDLYQTSINGGPEELLLQSTNAKNPYDWSPDGRFVVYADQSPTNRRDLWALPLDGDRKPFPVAATAFSEQDERFSADGKWLAYESNDTGRYEIYLQQFPSAAAGRIRVSTGGGTFARWRGDGRELFYRAGNDVMAVPITSRASTIEAGTPVRLFALPQNAEYSPIGSDRFLVNTPTDVPVAPITIILNWKGAAK